MIASHRNPLKSIAAQWVGYLLSCSAFNYIMSHIMLLQIAGKAVHKHQEILIMPAYADSDLMRLFQLPGLLITAFALLLLLLNPTHQNASRVIAFLATMSFVVGFFVVVFGCAAPVSVPRYFRNHLLEVPLNMNDEAFVTLSFVALDCWFCIAIAAFVGAIKRWAEPTFFPIRKKTQYVLLAFAIVAFIIACAARSFFEVPQLPPPPINDSYFLYPKTP